MFKIIVWASDGSENADRALQQARELAESASAQLIAVHVKETLVTRWAGYPVHVDEGEVDRKLSEQATALKDAGIDVRYEQPDSLSGGAAHVIADFARERGADLIVVGTRGHGPVVGLLLGSVTQRLLHVAPCPVLVVPPEGK